MNAGPFTATLPLRPDLQVIADMVQPGARVLDVGCGDGALLRWLVRNKGVDGRGVELSQAGVNSCVAQGLSVIQGDADTDLADYPAGAFDYVILSETLQATRNPRQVLTELMRIGGRAIVSFPNFGHWRVRWHLLFQGTMPVTQTLSQPWHATPNIHLCTIRDFEELAGELGLSIERFVTVDGRGGRVISWARRACSCSPTGAEGSGLRGRGARPGWCRVGRGHRIRGMTDRLA
jgi:methionine biosynthesis protein MetW